MIYQEHPIQVQGSTPDTRLCTYLISHSDEINIQTRPLIIICPGGGYCFLSDREAEMLALQWNAYGYHAAVLYYSVEPARYPTALTELAASVKFMKEHAKEWHIDTEHIIIQGSSAGGHLAANYGMFWKKDFLSEELGVSPEILRPAGMILNYPVITSGPYAHEDSFRCLLGEDYEKRKDGLSLENQVSADTPPAFIWCTDEDGLVPAENSLLLALEMRKKHIPVELHLYAKGGHGLALADERTNGMDNFGIEKECQSWVSLANTWLREVVFR
ncbi:MAG: alpha/beta hydrolase [Ruminococcus sp.]|nr:alpha/beta hydrolase [Ruminococcus sp.]